MVILGWFFFLAIASMAFFTLISLALAAPSMFLTLKQPERKILYKADELAEEDKEEL